MARASASTRRRRVRRRPSRHRPCRPAPGGSVGAAVRPLTSISSRPRQGTATAGRMRARQRRRSAAERKPPIAFTSAAICAAISPSYRSRSPACCSRSSVAGRLPSGEIARAALIGRHRRQAVRQVDPGAFGIEAQHGGRGGDLQRGVPVLRQAALRQRHRRGQHVAERQAAMRLVQQGIAGDRRGHDEGERAVDVAVALDLRPGEQVALHPAGQRVGAGVERRPARSGRSRRSRPAPCRASSTWAKPMPPRPEFQGSSAARAKAVATAASAAVPPASSISDAGLGRVP